MTRWENMLGRCESPIERMFLDALCWTALEHGYEVAAQTPAFPAFNGTIIIGTQKTLGKYRADFLISYPFFGSFFSAVIECDGHEFHERTKKQAERDKKRDRAIQSWGHRLFRFTGSEIHRDARQCAAEVLDTLMDFQTSTILKAMQEQEEDAA